MKQLLVSAVAAVVVFLGCSSGGTSATGYVLNVNNFDSWCTVSVDGAPLNASASYTFDAGTVVDLDATANAGFVWAYWLNTDGAAANGGKDPEMSTTVTMTSNKDVLACCDNLPSQPCPSSL